MKETCRFLCGAIAIALLASAQSLHAAWTSNSLPVLSMDFGSYRLGQMADGRLVYGTNDDLDRQSSFGGAFVLDDYSATIPPFTWDPSSVAIYNDTLGAIGAGTFGPSEIYIFNPTNLGTAFTAIPGLTLQNYSLVFRDSTSLYVGGNNGTNDRHAISYVTLAGAQKVIIDDISLYSADFAIDIGGNLYVSDNDDRKLYKFSVQQLNAAIAGAPLSIADGLYLTTTAKNGSLAVDGFGRIWSAGYQTNGIDVFDPADGGTKSFVPALANKNYVVDTFSVGGESYVAYVNASGAFAGAALTYGYQRAADLVPEPGSVLLFVSGVAGLALRRRRR